MITSVFKKSTPINYSLAGILLLFFFFLYQTQNFEWTKTFVSIGITIGLMMVLLASLFIINFIVKKNILTKDSTFSLFFFTLFLLLFPSVFNNQNLIISNFFILLAIRRLVSLQTLKSPKEKIFDASLWIFAASLFHFWAILFLILVYVSIIFHVSRDYRNWLIPFVALFLTAIFFMLFTLLIDKNALVVYINNSQINLNIDYFKNTYQNIAFSIFVVIVVYYFVSSIFSLTSKPLNLQASYKKIIVAFLIGVAIFIISPNKSNDVLVFTFLPLSVMATNIIEYSNSKLKNEITLALTIILCVFTFVTQL